MLWGRINNPGRNSNPIALFEVDLATMVSFYAGALQIWALTVLYVIARHIRWKRDMKRRNPQGLPYPPGPKPLPIIGSTSDSARYLVWRQD